MISTYNHTIITKAQKSGTVSLHHPLSKHPSISASSPKECNYLVKPLDSIQRYKDFFSVSSVNTWLLDMSIIYMLRCHEIAPRIAKELRKTRIIIILLNSVERLYSQYHMLAQRGGNIPSLSDILSQDHLKQTISQVRFHENTGYRVEPQDTLLLFSQYSWQLQSFLKYLGKSQVLIIKYEQLLHRHNATTNAIFAFLGINTVEIKQGIRYKRAYPPLQPRRSNSIFKLLESEITQLELLLNCNLPEWRTYIQAADDGLARFA